MNKNKIISGMILLCAYGMAVLMDSVFYDLQNYFIERYSSVGSTAAGIIPLIILGILLGMHSTYKMHKGNILNTLLIILSLVIVILSFFTSYLPMIKNFRGITIMTGYCMGSLLIGLRSKESK